MEKISVKYAGAAAMYFVSKKLKKKYNITDERAALYEAAETWVDALDGREFLGMYSTVELINKSILIQEHAFTLCVKLKPEDISLCFNVLIFFYGGFWRSACVTDNILVLS